jgi:hypothetical protein
VTEPASMEHTWAGMDTLEPSNCQDSEAWFAAVNYARVPGRTAELRFVRIARNGRHALAVHGGHATCVRTRPWRYTEHLTASALSRLGDRPNVDGERLRHVLAYDAMTEGDALRLFDHVASTIPEAPDSLWPALLLWLRDELNHAQGFAACLESLFGCRAASNAEDESNFTQFGQLTSDPFYLLLALAYDEIATVQGYLKDLPLYLSLGPPMERFIRRVIADEGAHFRSFVDLLVTAFPAHLGEAADILDRVVGMDGRKYQRTFVLDHDPRVEAQFTLASRQQAQKTVLRVLKTRQKAAFEGRLAGESAPQRRDPRVPTY